MILGVLPCLGLSRPPSDTSTSNFNPPFGSFELGDGSPVGDIGGGGYGYDVGEEGIGGSRRGEEGARALGDTGSYVGCVLLLFDAQGNRAWVRYASVSQSSVLHITLV